MQQLPFKTALLRAFTYTKSMNPIVVVVVVVLDFVISVPYTIA